MELMMLEGYSCAEQVIWLLVVSYTACNRSAGAVTLTGAHLCALSEKFGVGTSLGTAKLSDPFSQAMAPHQSSLLSLCF